MYLPSHFEEKRREVLHQLISEHPLGALVTLGQEGLNANHVAFEFDPEPAPFGTLRAHVARSNPVWQDFSKEIEALVVFSGRAGLCPAFLVSDQAGRREGGADL